MRLAPAVEANNSKADSFVGTDHVTGGFCPSDKNAPLTTAFV